MQKMKLSPAGLALIKKSQRYQVEQDAELRIQQTQKGLCRFVAELNINLTQHQFDALGSLAYHVGLGALKKSPLGKKLYLMRQDDQASIYAVADEFHRWIKTDGIISPRLIQKRGEERLLFLGVTS